MRICFMYFENILRIYGLVDKNWIFENTRPRAGLRPAWPSGIVGRVHLLHVHFSRLALRLRRSAWSNYARTTLCKTDLVMKKPDLRVDFKTLLENIGRLECWNSFHPFLHNLTEPSAAGSRRGVRSVHVIKSKSQNKAKDNMRVAIYIAAIWRQ